MWEWVVVVFFFKKKMNGSGSLFFKIGGNGLFLLKNGWEWVDFVKKWVGMGCFCWKMGMSG